MYFLKYKEQELPVIVDFAVIKNVCSKLNIKLTQFESSIENLDDTVTIVFEGLKRGHKLEGTEFKLSESDVVEILSVEDNYAQFFKLFSECVLKMFTIPTESNKKK